MTKVEELKERLRGAKINLSAMARKYHQEKNLGEDLLREVEDLQSQLAEACMDKGAAENALREAAWEIESLQSQLNESRADAAHWEFQHEKMQSQLAAYKSSLDAAKSEVQRLLAEKDAAPTAQEPVNQMLLDALKRCKFDSLNMSFADFEFCRAAIAAAEERSDKERSDKERSDKAQSADARDAQRYRFAIQSEDYAVCVWDHHDCEWFAIDQTQLDAAIKQGESK